MFDRIELLHIIEKNARLSVSDIAIRMGETEDTVAAELQKLQNEGVILGFSSVVDWDKTERESVTAMIEIRITPQRNKGFNQIASQLYQYPQVTSCFLMSGGFDIMLMIEDSTLREVASFVSEKVAPIDGVVSTSTHFILKRYKSNGIIFDSVVEDDRETIVL
mgnify:CR=1 FL=1